MAKSRFGISFDGFEDLMARLDELGGSDAMERGAEAALKKSKEYVTPKIEAAMVPSNLPAGGKYSNEEGTRKSIDRDMKVTWKGMEASANIGFRFPESGLKSIFLMFGTQSMKPVKGLKTAIYGNKTKKEIAKIQQEEMEKVISRIMEGS